eukprot:TRINITY_DN6337_c0_g1_i1.p2 TRINITY_DN6337_c0_g1~~TRINITY_DN6337_c0_g1_i1.p2  ORF type:complete len:56 (-),score=8.46 TRINITY_DN6337_c0_g1_i1:225-392(-)
MLLYCPTAIIDPSSDTSKFLKWNDFKSESLMVISDCDAIEDCWGESDMLTTVLLV